MTWLGAILDLLFPPRCILCGGTINLAPDECLCERCWFQIAYVRPPLCACCGKMVTGRPDHNHICGPCLRNPPPYVKARSIIFYDQPARLLLHRLKYHGDTTVLPAIRSIIERSRQRDMLADAEIIVPVPLNVKRLRARGLNQADLIARQLFFERKKDIRTDVLVRARDTGSQTVLSGEARRNNLRGAFQVSRGACIEGRTICLVDDVFTTGTTVRECASELLKSGAKQVQVLTLARVSKKK